MKSSVAICTYNGEKYIEEQLTSILNQTRKVDEIVICDDQSNDHTIEIVKRVLRSQLIPYRIIINEQPLHVVRNFEKCYAQCTHDIIFSCDQDDVWKTNKVEKMMHIFESMPQIDFIATNADLIDENNHKFHLSLRDSVGFSDDAVFMDELLKKCCITGATMAFRKTFGRQYFNVCDYLIHDGWLAFIAVFTDRFIYLDDHLIAYRLHGNNVCGVGDVDILKNGTINQLEKRKKHRLKKEILTSPLYYQDYAEIMFRTCSQLKEFIEDKKLYNKENMDKLIKCLEFWQQRKSIQYLSFFELQKMRHEFSSNKFYERFTEDAVFYYADFYFWFIYHLFRSKNHR